jgi:ubiquinone/menaquinone biosynthesis C-methylase UbiE
MWALGDAAKWLSERTDFFRAGRDNESTRERWIREALAALPNAWRVLDAGAGEQRHKAYCGHLNYVSQDFAKYDGTGDQRGLHSGSWNQTGLDLVSDITAIPASDGSFDAVLCTEVLEHLPHPIKALQELGRVLRPGGHLILTAPFLSMTHLAPYHYCTGFSSYFYRTALPELGFDVIEVTHNGNFFEFVAQELRRVQSISARYSVPQTPRPHETIATAIVLRMLGRLSKADVGSSEFCSFGLHVRAIKR